MSAFGGFQGSHRTLGIARVAFSQILQKGTHISRKTFANQLLIAPLGTRFCARREKNLQFSVRKNHGTHIPAISDQTGCLPKTMLQIH